MASPESSRVVRGTAAWTVLLAGSACVVALFFDAQLALKIALGALIGSANIFLLARAIDQAMHGAVEQAEHDPQSAGLRPLAAVKTLVRMPLLVVALVIILWYLPARPEGLAMGFVLVLVAATVAAIQARAHGTSPTSPTSDG